MSDSFAFEGDQAARPEKGQGKHQHGERKGFKGESSEAAKEFRAAQRAELEEFIGLNEEELKEMHNAGEKMSETLSDQKINEDDMKDFLEDQLKDLVDFIINEKELDNDRVNTLENRMSDRIERQLERWYN